MTSCTLRRTLRIGALWLGILAIWALWFAGGPSGAWKLYRWSAWTPFPNDSAETFAFAPVTTGEGGVELISFQELRRGGRRVPSFLPPPALVGTSPDFDARVERFYGPHPDPAWKPSATLAVLDSSAEGTRYEIVVRYPDATEWRWRYRATPERVVPLEWSRLRDTAGILLIPLTLMIWILGIPPACWATRRLFRFQKGIAA